jgi:LemA protein
MRKFLPWIIVIAVLGILYFWVKGINNTAVTLNQNIEEAWGNVQTSYQRRNDLIGNLVNTVKGYAEHEKSYPNRRH